MKHQFQDSKKVGTDGEALIAAYLSPSWIVTRAGKDLQRRGVDLVLTSKNGDGGSYTVEVKTDTKADRTGNAFIEIQSTTTQEGWAVTCRADYLFYFLRSARIVYVLKPKQILDQLDRWRSMYPMISLGIDRHETIGISVPFHELGRFAKLIDL